MQTSLARWFHEGRLKPVRLIVVHCTVSPEMGTGAEGVANYFKTGTRKASAHRVCDNDSTVLCVRDLDTAFAAAGANSDGLHLELVGYPDQSSDQWLDTFGRSMLQQAGSTIREWAAEFHIPHRWLTVAQVADGKTAGFCTHHDVSRAFPDVSTGHWDPGPNFPKTQAMALWFPNKENDDMPLNEADKEWLRQLIEDAAGNRAVTEGSGGEQRSDVWRWSRESVLALRELLKGR
jgi:hypothetical protein